PALPYRFIQAGRANPHVRTLCHLLGVSTSGYYAFCSRPPSRHAVADGELTKAIEAAHAASRGTYGAPRVHAVLRLEGHRCAKKRVARLMRRACLQGGPPRRRYRTPPRAPALPLAPDPLGPRLTPPAPHRGCG